MNKPKLRQVNAFPMETDGRQFICLQDPMRLTDKQVFLDSETFFIISMMDGEHDLADIQLKYTRRFGTILLNNRLEGIIRDLDDNFLLEGPTFERAMQNAVEEFRRQSVRHAEHAGQAYESDPAKLKTELDGIMKLVPSSGRSSAENARLTGLIVPHIDISSGAEGYAHAYGAVAENGPADLYVILGISHSATSSEFALTTKEFQTPLGTARTDRDFINELASSFDVDYFQDEFAHKHEHSIEFQVLFLQHVLGNESLKIVPILCGGFHQQIEDDIQPEMDTEIREFLETLKAKINGYDGRVCVVAGVDLSHIGTKFGTPGQLDSAQLNAIEQLDREMLTLIEKTDTSAFFRHIELDKNGRNVCGFPAIYSLMYLLNGARVDFLYYGQQFEPSTSSMVSFTSMAVYE